MDGRTDGRGGKDGFYEGVGKIDLLYHLASRLLWSAVISMRVFIRECTIISKMQRALLFLEKTGLDSASYHVGQSTPLDGEFWGLCTNKAICGWLPAGATANSSDLIGFCKRLPPPSIV